MIDEGIALCHEAVDAFGAGADPQWLARPPASRLSEVDRARLRREMGDILGLWARSLASRHEVSTDRRAEQTAEVERLIALAEASYGSAGAPRDLKLQSAAMARLAGRDAEADRLIAEAEATPRPPPGSGSYSPPPISGGARIARRSPWPRRRRGSIRSISRPG